MNPRACLLLHGFTGGPHELEPLARHLSSLGWICSVPTLAGHGGPLRSLRDIHRSEWIATAAAAADSLQERFGTFDLVGFSMGGLIAAYLSNRYPVRKLVLLNAAVTYISPRRFVQNAVRQVRSGSAEQLRVKHETPVRSVFQFMQLVRELKPEIDGIRVPTLIVQGDLDEIVHPRSARYINNRIQGEKELAVFPNSRHMICLGQEAEELFLKVERFLLK
ncbi:alpha/beta hydrolase [Paenibacillus alkalitolerans]|uniref:alpha/beta hydrolase n=1 Tax=Paenibacillus alkalitolerans TaxID=2799335 RepID=UPI0018F716BD|nr:alpha/beta fold hydrolase [Paenibacillus alkalitolerans]